MRRVLSKALHRLGIKSSSETSTHSNPPRKHEPKHESKHEPKRDSKHESKHEPKHEHRSAPKHEPKHEHRSAPKHEPRHEPKHAGEHDSYRGKFSLLGLASPLLKALAEEGYESPTPIQTQAIPAILSGGDLIGCAQTGTGKTAAFALPLLQRLTERPQRIGGSRPEVLVLTPTRELALQIHESFVTYGRHTSVKSAVIFGGVGQNPQVAALRRHPRVLVATPGRLMDLMNQRLCDISGVETFVLDEADRMLDMGFIHDVRKIVKALPTRRQTLLFSATMPPDIKKLASQILHEPQHIAVNPVTSTPDAIEQHVFMVNQSAKRSLLVHLLQDRAMTRTLVFTRTKHVANRVAEHLCKEGIEARAIHSNKSQSARQAALAAFKAGKVMVLVASDIASRGIDVDKISHVVNYDLPNVPETYVHRIGRTGRAREEGIAFSFCDSSERAFLKDIEKHLGRAIPRREDHPFHGQAPEPAAKPQPSHHSRGSRGPRRPSRKY